MQARSRGPGSRRWDLIGRGGRGLSADIDDVNRANRRSRVGPACRRPATLLHRYADAIEDNLELLASLESLDVGKPVTGP